VTGNFLFSTGIEPGRPTSMCLIYTAYQVHACVLCNYPCPVSFPCISYISIINVYGRLLYVAESALMDMEKTRTNLVTYDKAEVLKHPTGVHAVQARCLSRLCSHQHQLSTERLAHEQVGGSSSSLQSGLAVNYNLAVA
jgi:hypothetical protein